MTTKNVNEELIYESPDGGKTVYCRKPGESQRTLHHIDPVYEREQKLNSRWQNLKEAVYMANTDKALDYAIERVEILYALKKTED